MPMNGTSAADAIDEKIAAEHAGGAGRGVFHPPQRQRDQRDDDEGVEDHRREEWPLGRDSPMMLSTLSSGMATMNKAG